MGAKVIPVVSHDGSLELSDVSFQSTEEWHGKELDQERILLSKSETGPEEELDACGVCSVDVFGHSLLGLIDSNFSGLVKVDTHRGIKQLVFEHGELRFARSNVMDDRLGEVIYRNGDISLDQLTDSAVQVTRTRKFGQILITSGIFSSVKLWGALQDQFLEIMRSIFLVDKVYYEIKEGFGFAPTQVVYGENTKELVEESISFGRTFREFTSRLSEETVIKLRTSQIKKNFASGSFLTDIVEIIKENNQLHSIVDSSKLTDFNTYIAIMNLINQGICEIENLRTNQMGFRKEDVGTLKIKLDEYGFLIRESQPVFENSSIPFPYDDLKDFALSLNPPGFITIFLYDNGEVAKESVLSMYSQSTGNPERIAYFRTKMESLIQFFLQISGDLLPYEKAKEIKSNFQKMR